MFFQNGSYSGVHGNVDLMGAEWKGRECRCATGVLGLAADSESPAELTRTKIWALPLRDSVLLNWSGVDPDFFFLTSQMILLYIQA